MSEKSIPLTEVLRGLRAEIAAAQAEGETESVRFALGAVEVELEMVVTKEANGSIGFSVFGGGGKLGTTRTHRIKLTLTPHGESGADVLLGDTVPGRPR